MDTQVVGRAFLPVVPDICNVFTGLVLEGQGNALWEIGTAPEETNADPRVRQVVGRKRRWFQSGWSSLRRLLLRYCFPGAVDQSQVLISEHWVSIDF